MERQPSSSRFSPSKWMISGFTSTILASGFFPLVTSTTVRRMLFPICGAARPMPCAAYMVANMSSASSASSASNLEMALDGFSRMGSPYFKMVKILRAGPLGGGAALVSAAAVFASFNLGLGASEVVDLSGIALEVAAKLLQGVPPKFLQKSIGEDKCNHGLGCDGSRGHHAPVGALVSSLNRLLGDHVGGSKGAAQGGDGFEITTDDDIFAVADAAFEAACPIGGTRKPTGDIVVENFVLYFAAERACGENACAD